MKIPRSDLEYARLVRKKRSDIKKSLKKGYLNLNQLFNDGDLYSNYIANMKILNLVGSLPNIGSVNTKKILRKLKISLIKRVKGLGKNQKVIFFKYFGIYIKK